MSIMTTTPRERVGRLHFVAALHGVKGVPVQRLGQRIDVQLLLDPALRFIELPVRFFRGDDDHPESEDHGDQQIGKRGVLEESNFLTCA